MGDPVKGGASMPGRDQCPKQTGSDIHARGDLRGRGTQIEYDRKGKYSLLPRKGNFAHRTYCYLRKKLSDDQCPERIERDLPHKQPIYCSNVIPGIEPGEVL